MTHFSNHNWVVARHSRQHCYVLREEAQPKYCKVRKIPFALKPVVGAELDRLEKEQVLEKVTHSYWATPLVVHGQEARWQSKICGDFKVTLNPALNTDVNPNPPPRGIIPEIEWWAQVFKT